MTLRKTLNWLLAGAAFLILQACGSGSAPVDETPSEAPIGVESPIPEGEVGEAGVEYEFTFVYNEAAAQANSLHTQAAGDEVIFRWSWGDGNGDFAIVTVDADGNAEMTVEHTYNAEGPYGIVISVEEPESPSGEPGAQLAELNYVVQIGEVLEVEDLVLQCNGTESQRLRGERGVHLHTWDISDAPAGATIDIWFDTVGQPDKYIMEYPEGTVVLDTGWRGNPGYDGEPAYPGGIQGGTVGTFEDVFTKESGQDELVMTIIGPEAGTVWHYTLTCNP